MPWSILLSFLTGLPGVIGDYFKTKQQIELANVQTQKELALANLKAASDQSISADNRSIEGLKISGTGFKYCVFWLISSPFIACIIGQPWYATMVFSNLQALPNWYMILYSGIIGVIWGIPVPGSVMGTVWEGIKDSTAARREFKLAKIDKKAYWSAYKALHKGAPLSQATVDSENAVLDQLDKDNAKSGS